MLKYTIRPLVWVEEVAHPRVCQKSSTPDGSFEARYDGSWQYDHDERYGMKHGKADNIEQAKIQAEKYWQETVRQYLWPAPD